MKVFEHPHSGAGIRCNIDDPNLLPGRELSAATILCDLVGKSYFAG
jgi:hypothetical protein